MHDVLREVALSEHTTLLAGYEQAILNCVAAHASPEDGWPDLATITQWTNLTPKKAQKAIARLVSLGFLLQIPNEQYAIPLDEAGHFAPVQPQEGGNGNGK